ncbi:MAG: hypothetical protein IJK70_02335 [Bacteroidales bacterium]|nr:hypothetical protein [Bacteroidales bacterium]
MNKLSIILSALACCLSLSGCIESAIKENMMEQASGKYILTSFKCDGKDVNVSRLSPEEVLSAEVYSSDGKWYFDCVFPDTDYHGGFEYRKLVLPLSWNSALGMFVFDVSNSLDQEEVSEASINGGTVKISTNLVLEIYDTGRIMQRIHTVTCQWTNRTK